MHSQLFERLKGKPKKWLITGVAGFIGSNLLQALLEADQQVVGLDNFSTGKKQNIMSALNSVRRAKRGNFVLIQGDIRHRDTCQNACRRVDYVLHQAAIGSVPRSIEDPHFSNENNVTGFLNMLLAARDQKARRFVYASSSAVYGDAPELPKIEIKVGRPLSPYAVTKAVNEWYAEVFWKTYGVPVIGLRYFNVFGPRQDCQSAYAAVIPRWLEAMTKNEPSILYGDGSTSRDFCYVANAVQANLLAATTESTSAIGEVFNVATHHRTTLRQLFEAMRCKLLPHCPHLHNYEPAQHDFRRGDIQHSHADISKANSLLCYAPTHTLEQGLDETIAWFRSEKSAADLKPN